jgi:Transposase DDE domain
MRSRKNHKVSSLQVQAHARHLLEPILGTGNGARCTTAALLKVVLTAAAQTISLFAACLRLQTMSDQTARTSLRSRLPKRRRAALEAKLNASLRYSVSRSTRRHRRNIACDLHEIPYHGTAAKNHLRGNKSRDGTTQFFVYATACIVEHGHRYTLAYTWVQHSDTMVTVLERLVDGIEKSAVPIRRLLLDRGFFRSNVLAYLRGRNVPFLMPVMFRGRKPAQGKAATGWRTFLRKKAGWHQHVLMADDQPIRINVCVGYKTFRHHRTNRRHNKKLVFAASGTRETPRQICEVYRRRFGIETSYRQLGQARIRTSTRDPILRLFFVGLALVLRNLWAWLQGLLFGEKPSPQQQAAAKKRQFRRLLMLLIEGIQQESAFDPLLT